MQYYLGGDEHFGENLYPGDLIPTSQQDGIFLLSIVLIIFTRPKIIFTLFSTGSKIIQWLESQNVIFIAESHLFPSKLDTPGYSHQCPTAVQPEPSIPRMCGSWSRSTRSKTEKSISEEEDVQSIDRKWDKEDCSNSVPHQSLPLWESLETGCVKAGLGVPWMKLRCSTIELFCEACYGWYTSQRDA